MVRKNENVHEERSHEREGSRVAISLNYNLLDPKKSSREAKYFEKHSVSFLTRESLPFANVGGISFTFQLNLKGGLFN